jgi:radical SAM superfamily enzyme with C-terminal helix-hairpin-helix motif
MAPGSRSADRRRRARRTRSGETSRAGISMAHPSEIYILLDQLAVRRGVSARHSGRCSVCERRIRLGDVISRAEVGWAHIACAVEADAR